VTSVHKADVSRYSTISIERCPIDHTDFSLSRKLCQVDRSNLMHPPVCMYRRTPYPCHRPRPPSTANRYCRRSMLIDSANIDTSRLCWHHFLTKLRHICDGLFGCWQIMTVAFTRLGFLCVKSVYRHSIEQGLSIRFTGGSHISSYTSISLFVSA
jgi:hypothetical protein